MTADLLPQNGTPFERAMSETMDETTRVSGGIGALRTAKMVSVPEAFLPFLIYEYGLGEVSPYIADKRDLIRTGLDWQRVRGTPSALARSLRWLGLFADLVEAPPRRRRWNTFQASLGSIPASNDLLTAIEILAGLSAPARSKFIRGFRGYDVREAEWSTSRWGAAAWSSASGVRVAAGGAKWSFGRPHDIFHVATQAELEAIDAWVGPGGEGAGWGEYAWDSSDASWIDADEQARVSAMVDAILSRPLSLALYTAGDELIGYRRARAAHPVMQDYQGAYAVGGVRYRVEATAPTGVYAEFFTGFGDGGEAHVSRVSVVSGAAVSPAGALWARPGLIDAPGTVFFDEPVAVDLRRATRQRFRFYITF